MISHTVSDDELLAYACRDLDPLRRAEVELAMRTDAARAVAARKMASAYESLRSLSFDVSAEFNIAIHHRWTVTVTAPNYRAPSGRKIAATRASRPAPRFGASIRRTLDARSVAVAAGLCIAAAITWLSLMSPRATAAYDLSDVPLRLVELQSLHVKGWVYRRIATADGFRIERRPQQWYVERPHRYWRSTGSGAAQTVMLSDGRQWMSTDPEQRPVVKGRDIPRNARLRVELMLQHQMVTELTGALRGPYDFVRSEPVEGLEADVYQRMVFRNDKPIISAVIWLNPKTGLPLKTRTYLMVGPDREFLHSEYDAIRPNAPRPPHALSFLAPEGYEVVQRDMSPDAVKMGSVHMDGKNAVVRLAMNVHDRAILVCWGRSQRRDAAPIDLSILDGDWHGLTVKPAGLAGPWWYAHHVMRIDRGPSHDWLWSLILPTDPDEGIGSQPYAFNFGFDDSLVSVVLSALQFGHDELAQIIYDAQSLNHHEVATPEHPITLEQIAEQDAVNHSG